MKTISTHRCFGGTLGYYSHESTSTRGTMRLSVFVPPQANVQASCPALIYLSGLTCTEDNFTVKGGAYRVAAELGLIIVAPDTSPRGEDVPDDDSIALGKGAGFYLDATEEPWAKHYQMYSYVAEELPMLIRKHFAISTFGLFGHSMGGHGALTIALRNPQTFKSISAFAPICHPMEDGWGPMALTAYLGPDKARWRSYDACALMQDHPNSLPPILIDQGLADSAYQEGRLNPEAFESVCKNAGQQLTLRFHEGYDHGYFFIQTFMEDHLRHHAQYLA